MAARLTDWQKNKILADYVQLGSYRAVGKMNNVSDTTVRNLVLADPDTLKACEQKKKENVVDVFAYMETQKSLVCSFIGKGLELLNDPEKLEKATLSQITTAMGTIIDKWTLVGKETGEADKDDELSKSLRALAERIDDGPDRAV